MPIPFLGQLVLGVGLLIASYLLAPKPKTEKPPTTEDLESPTAEAGRPIPVVFGSLTVKSPNLIGDWDKLSHTRTAQTGGKK